MRKIILVAALFVVFALVVAPALAAKPERPHTMMWKGSGIDETGSRVQFSGSAVQMVDGTMYDGTATFVDRGRDIVADLRFDIADVDPVAGSAWFGGHADVTVGDTTYPCDVGLYLNKATSTYDMWLTRNTPSIPEWNLYTTVSGDDFKGTIRFT